MHHPHDQISQRWSPLFRAAAAPSHPSVFEVFHAYVLEVTDLSRDRLAVRMASILGAEARNAVMSTADKLRAEGRTLGHTEGHREGRVAGKIEGRAEILLCQLRKRFGAIAETVTDRLRAASTDELDRWALRTLDAPTLDAVFAVD